MGRLIVILLVVATAGFLGSSLPSPFIAYTHVFGVMFGTGMLGAFVLAILWLIRRAPWWVLRDKPRTK